MADIEENPSNRSTCRACGNKIKDAYRFYFAYKGNYGAQWDYYHIDCILKKILNHKGPNPEKLVTCPGCDSTYDYEIDGAYWSTDGAGIQMKCVCGKTFSVKVYEIIG